jgi:hypothetical protein
VYCAEHELDCVRRRTGFKNTGAPKADAVGTLAAVPATAVLLSGVTASPTVTVTTGLEMPITVSANVKTCLYLSMRLLVAIVSNVVATVAKFSVTVKLNTSYTFPGGAGGGPGEGGGLGSASVQ